MPKKEVPLLQLSNYLPDGAYEPVSAYLHHYKVHLTIAKNRNSILGDYRHKTVNGNHRISVNGSLNKYAFLITLLHELAHLITFDTYGRDVYAHGKEWKHVYGQMLATFSAKQLFPNDITTALQQSLHNPGASTCAEEGLQRVLRKYDDKKPGYCMVEELTTGCIFTTSDGRLFQKGAKRVKKHVCTELATGKKYLFSAVYEVRVVQNP